jgi:hypothetical protein
MARQRKDHPRPSQSARCSLCGSAFSLDLMVPDGGQACADIRWYCKDAKSCTERWTARRPGTGRLASTPSAGKPRPGAALDPLSAGDPVPTGLLGIPEDA